MQTVRCTVCDLTVDTRARRYLKFACPAPCRGFAHHHCVSRYVDTGSEWCPMCQCVPPPPAAIIKEASLAIDPGVSYTNLAPLIEKVVSGCVEKGIRASIAKPLHDAMFTRTARKDHNAHIESFAMLVATLTLAELAEVCTPEDIARSGIPPEDLITCTISPCVRDAVKLFGVGGLVSTLPATHLLAIGVTPKWIAKQGIDRVVPEAPLQTLLDLNMHPALMVALGMSAGAFAQSPTPLGEWMKAGLTLEHMALMNLSFDSRSEGGVALKDSPMREAAYDCGVLRYS